MLTLPAAAIFVDYLSQMGGAWEELRSKTPSHLTVIGWDNDSKLSLNTLSLSSNSWFCFILFLTDSNQKSKIRFWDQFVESGVKMFRLQQKQKAARQKEKLGKRLSQNFAAMTKDIERSVLFPKQKLITYNFKLHWGLKSWIIRDVVYLSIWACKYANSATDFHI